ncbi:hypothetical protein N7509_003089 [Penicillium cosmopolitanum]|uniref:Uncharacterized protein n=1 Tax=Penicillium cosmopolitanum TaxID=1131564 RepID=A0A9W9W492_9EURO|nr:uncharacterized protein N7509_003089 [Penicillium cosmopolitanum]KAJ5403218.1 hypothetical protein N7509_003089 [Penicillium cosmopolitanum]
MIQKFNALPSFHGNLALGKSLVAAPGLAPIWEQVFNIAAHAMQRPVQERTPPAVPASAQISLLRPYIVELVRQIHVLDFNPHVARVFVKILAQVFNTVALVMLFL